MCKLRPETGKFESVSRIDKKNGLVYYLSTEQHPTQSHLYTVSLATHERKLTVIPPKPRLPSSTHRSAPGATTLYSPIPVRTCPIRRFMLQTRRESRSAVLEDNLALRVSTA